MPGFTSIRCLRSIRIPLLLWLASIGVSAFAAQNGSNSQVGSLPFGFQWIIENLLTQSMLDQFVDGAIGIASGLTGPAKVLAGTLALISLIWGVTMAFINKKPPVNALVEAVIFAGLAALMIQNFTWVADGARHYAGEVMNGQSIASKAGEFVMTLFLSFGAIVENVLKSVVSIKSLFNVTDALIAFVAVFVAIVFGFLSLVTLIGLALQGPFALGIGLSISPLIGATIANPYTRRWFDQWLNFMIGAAFLTAMVYVALTLLMTPLINIMQTVSSGQQTSLAGVAIQAAILMFFASKMLAAVPSIADSLFPGRTGAGSISSSAGDIAKSAASIATSVAALKVASIAAAKFTGSAAVGTLNAAGGVASAMKSGLDFARNQAGGNVGEKTSAGVMAAGVDYAGKPAAAAVSAMRNAGAKVADAWNSDKANGVQLGDRVANAVKNSAETIGKTNVADMAAGTARMATGAAVTAAGLAGHTASGAVGKVVQGASDQVNQAKAAAERRKSVRDDLLKGFPPPDVRYEVRSSGNKKP
jgi:type IV secretion system protein TrbL